MASQIGALAQALFPNPSPAERTLLDSVLHRFERDRPRYFNVLEWSLSEDSAGIDTARFSYGFPGMRRDRDESIAPELLRWMDALGPAEGKAARGVLNATRHPAVEQVLVGFARGTAGVPRTKLYLQFTDGAGTAPLELARTIVGLKVPTQSDALQLHLLGLDLGPSGLSASKLYFVEPVLDLARARATFPGLERPLHNALWIHRLAHPDDAEVTQPLELDFGLNENALTWAELEALPALAPFEMARNRLASLQASFPIRVTRVSRSLLGPPKLNVYFLLDEPGSMTSKPPGGG